MRSDLNLSGSLPLGTLTHYTRVVTKGENECILGNVWTELQRQRTQIQELSLQRAPDRVHTLLIFMAGGCLSFPCA